MREGQYLQLGPGMDDIAGLLRPDDQITSPPWGEMGRSFTLAVVSLFSKAVLCGANTTEVHNREKMNKYIIERDREVGLLTVCNHTRYAHHASSSCVRAHQFVLWASELT